MKPSSTRLIAAIVLAISLLVPAAAMAASIFTPKLGFPNGQKVPRGPVTIKVKAAGASAVYVQIEPRRTLKHGFLVSCTRAGQGCDFAHLTPWKHHPGWWIYKAPAFAFHGWWSTSPDTYYWQAESFAKSPPCSSATSNCIFAGVVGSFQIVR